MAGYRVLRGPDWEEGDADGGEGHLGTITELLSDGKVRVLWDKGQESTCRAGADGKFDLRIFDTGQSGVRHPNTKCQECGEENIYGVLWRCKVCAGYDLCSKCYSEDKHDIRHRFLRIDYFKSNGKEVKQRKTSVKMRAMGIFEGSKVTRGKHWLWGDQDGGPGTQGEVQTFENVAPDSTRNLVRVAWPNGIFNSYRLGFQGQVDLTCVEEEIGPFYYRDHLQLVDSSELPLPLAPVEAYTSSPPAISGETLSDTNISSSTTTSASVVTTSSTNTTARSPSSSSSSGRSSGSASLKGQDPTTMPIGGNESLGREASGTAITESVVEEDELLLVGDKVIIGVNEERLVKLQQMFGGCTKGMMNRIGVEGVVTAVPSLQTPAVSVKYTEKQSYRLNSAVLVKITSFIEGDVVRVRRDVQQVTFLNKRLGWSENIDKVCGKVGRVRAVDSRGHVTVRIGSEEWKFHAGCLLPALGAPLDDVKEEQRPDRSPMSDLGMFSNVARGTGSDRDLAPLMRLLGLEGEESSGNDNSDPRVQQLFININAGDSQTVRRMVEANRHLLTALHKDMTPLGYASYSGRMHVMDTLLDLGAELNGKDGKRRTALHRAIEGNEERAALHLIDKGADVKASSRNNQTPLHFAAIRGMVPVIARLVALGADVNATDYVGDTPIFEAINQGKDQAVQILLQQPSLNKHALSGRGFNILHQACLRGRSSVVEMILDADDHPYIDDRMNGEYTALHIAANNDHVECVGLLILLGGAIVDHGDGRRQLTPLHLACKRGQFRSAKCLIEMGANVNATDIYGSTPLHLAMGKLPEDSRMGSESVDKDMTADECIRMARLLIDSGAIVDVVDYNGQTPMDYGETAVKTAVQKYLDEMVDVVLSHGRTDVALALTPASDPITTTLTAGDSEDSGAADLTSPTPGSGAFSKQDDAVLLQDLLKGVSLQCSSCDRMSDVTLQPCGHKSICRKCADTVTCCPVCDVHIEDKEVDNTDDDISEQRTTK